MYKITIKYNAFENDIELKSFDELMRIDNYNDIKMLSIIGDNDVYYATKEEEVKTKKRIVYKREWVQWRNGRPAHYEIIPVEIDVDTTDRKYQQTLREYERRDYLPDDFMFPTSLIKFVLHSTNIVKIPKISHLNKLKKIHCLFNRLESFPNTPLNLEYLDISGNPIKILPILSCRLKELKCDGCELSSIDNILPDSLKILKCSNNKIKSINNLPKNIEWLNCSTNMITSLPYIPKSLSYLNCSYNCLNYLPISLFFSDVYNSELHNGQFINSNLNNEAKLLINNNPLCDECENHMFIKIQLI